MPGGRHDNDIDVRMRCEVHEAFGGGQSFLPCNLELPTRHDGRWVELPDLLFQHL